MCFGSTCRALKYLYSSLEIQFSLRHNGDLVPQRLQVCDMLCHGGLLMVHLNEKKLYFGLIFKNL